MWWFSVTHGRNTLNTCLLSLEKSKAGLTLNVVKFEWAQNKSHYRVYLLGDGELRLQVDEVEAICNCPRPCTKKEVRSFLGLTGWYGGLSTLMEKRQKNLVTWTDECETDFQTLKVKLLFSCAQKSWLKSKIPGPSWYLFSQAWCCPSTGKFRWRATTPLPQL